MTTDKGGRPKKGIDKKVFEGLCAIMCTKDDICGILSLDEKTLTRWCHETYGEGFSDIYKKKSAVGRASLRRHQFRKAEQGNVTMLIWLGKQFLDQKDKQEIEHRGNVDYPLTGEIDLSRLSDEELRALEEIYAKAEIENEQTEDSEGAGEA